MCKTKVPGWLAVTDGENGAWFTENDGLAHEPHCDCLPSIQMERAMSGTERWPSPCWKGKSQGLRFVCECRRLDKVLPVWRAFCYPQPK